jgi:hypothetical protein
MRESLLYCSAVFVGVSTHQLVSPALPAPALDEEAEEAATALHDEDLQQPHKDQQAHQVCDI